jgi:hypothetical protein
MAVKNLWLDHDVADWRREVASGDTFQGFEEWRDNRRVSERADYLQVPIFDVDREMEIAEQRHWINHCGGDLLGYIARYGPDTAPTIYAADIAHLRRLEER